jgi:transposase
MRATSLLRTILNLKHTKVVSFEFSDSGLVVDVAPTTRLARCGCCGRQCRRGYDARTRQWRHLDFAGMEVVLRYKIRRVQCDRCGVTTELVPWAEPGGWFTRDFEDTVALLAQRTDKTTVTQLMGISWQTVGSIIARVVQRRGPTDLLDDVTHIGIDEVSYKRHHHYLTVVTDHVRGRVIWAGVGRTGDTLRQFFDELGAERTKALKVVSVDMCQVYIDVLRERAPEAVLVFDRFHVQRLARDALDEVRRSQVRELKDTEEVETCEPQWSEPAAR